MKSSQLNRVLKLVRRTGDRFVIMDNSSDEVFVLMNLREYEKNLDGLSDWEDLNEEELENRVGENFSDWKRRQNFSEEISGAEEKLAANTDPVTSSFVETENFTGHNSYEEDFLEEDFKPVDLLEDFPSAEKEIKTEPKYIPNKEEEISSLPIASVNSINNDAYPLGGEEEDLLDLKDEENEPKFYLEPIV